MGSSYQESTERIKRILQRANMGKNKTCLQDTNCTILYEHILNEETVNKCFWFHKSLHPVPHYKWL